MILGTENEQNDSFVTTPKGVVIVLQVTVETVKQSICSGILMEVLLAKFLVQSSCCVAI